MRKFFIFAITALYFAATGAQTVRQELRDDKLRTGSNYYVYPGPTAKLSPAPKGKKPFYISHYGRHGSRFLINQREYDYPYAILQRADSLGKLSDKGREVMRRIGLLRQEAQGRMGELTPLGAQQHREIARRMYERFPEVFKGDASVDAKSTVVIRCILSMENALQELKSLNPKLRITHDASEHDMYYMNFQDKKLFQQKRSQDALQEYANFCDKYTNYRAPMYRLFNDTAYANRNINLFRMNLAFFKLASSAQGTEVGKNFDMYDIFSPDELYDNWLQANAFWYITYGAYPLNGGNQPFTQRHLLRNIIEQADSSIALTKPSATLRFGHETIVLPLACLLGINGFDQQITNLDELVNNSWINYRVFPMAANIQFIFYRRNPQDKDVLFKVLLNENEASLPIPTDCAPYYHWADFREYFLLKLATYKE